MPNFPEPNSPAFVPVYQIQRTDPVDAGAAGEGPSNLPIKNLVERTAYLKKEVEDLDTAVGEFVIGSTVQGYDPDLQAIAALNTNGVVARTGAGTAAIRPTGATGLAVLASADAPTARAAIGASPVASPTFTGTATAGKFIPTGDTAAGNGMYLPVANNLAFSTNGAERLRIDGAGSVGIGTSEVAGRLHVSGGNVFQDTLDETAYNATDFAAISPGLTLFNQAETANAFNSIRFFVGGVGQAMVSLSAIRTAPNESAFAVTTKNGSSSAGERFRIAANGNVGIGTSAPATRLHVDGTTSISGNTAVTSATESTSTTTGALVVTGGLGVGGALFAGQAATAGKFIPTGDTAAGNGMYLPVANNLAFSTNGAERLRIDGAGNVGIGTSGVAGRLHVSGGNIFQDTLDETAYDATDFAAISPGLTLFNQAETANAFNSIRFLVGGDGQAMVSLSAIRTAPNESAFAVTTKNGSSSAGERFRIAANGNVGIGTSAPATRLHVDGTIRYTNRPAAATITAIGFDANGDLRASSSSLRYKHDIQNLETGLEEVMKLRPVQFKFNGETRTNMGFIAEEVDELGLEDVMLYNEENQPEGVLYANMVSLLTKAIQEQQAQIEELKAKMNLLKGV